MQKSPLSPSLNHHLSLASIYNYFLLAIAKKTVILDYHKFCRVKLGHALLYYKTDSLTPGYHHEYLHTNNWEITQIVKILNQLGFWVDIVDRQIAASWLPSDKYQLFIGLGLDGSGRHFLKFARRLPRATKVLLAATANPEHHNQALNQRYDQFTSRTGYSLPRFRTAKDIDLAQLVKHTDHVISVGNNITNQTLSHYHLPIHKIYLSTAPTLFLDHQAYKNKTPNNFLFFAGAGNILKGLDLLLETFAALPHLNLHVCTQLEPDFLHHYQSLIDNANNIHLEGFLRVNSRRFMYLTSICGYIILPSCTEGSATSVTTCMRRGLVPVVTPQAGIDVGNFGHLIENVSVPQLTALVSRLSQAPIDSLRNRIRNTYQSSFLYTQSSFTDSFTRSIIDIISKSEKTVSQGKNAASRSVVAPP